MNKIATFASAAVLAISAGSAMADAVVIGGANTGSLAFGALVAGSSSQTVTGGDLVGDTSTGTLTWTFSQTQVVSLIGDTAFVTGTSVLDLGANTLFTSIHTCSDVNGGICPSVALDVPDNGVDSLSVSFDGGTNTFTYNTSDVSNGATVTVNGTVEISAVPVPAAAWLFGSALVGLAGIGRRRAA